jgi:hypothetical protein
MLSLPNDQRITLGYHAVLCLALAACERGGTFEIGDTEGRAFTATCKENAGCNLTPRKSTSTTSNTALTLRSDGRLLGVCERDGPPIACRAIVCESDDDCPVVDGVVRTCGNSLCSEPSRALSRTDVVMLCMAGTGLGHDQPLQRERYASALASGESQSLPAGCRKP